VEVRQNVTSYQQPTGVVGDVAVSAERLAELEAVEDWAIDAFVYLDRWDPRAKVLESAPAGLREKGGE